MSIRPVVCITMGDPSGIGPEITVKTLGKPEYYEICRPLVVGDMERIRQTIRLTSSKLTINAITSISEALFTYGTIDVLHIDIPGASQVPYSRISAVAGKAAASYIFQAIELAKQRQVDAVVTGPISKEAMHLAGYTRYAGHTEIFAEKTGTIDYAMMLAVKDLYIIHVSTHCSLREACNRATKERVTKVIELARDLIDTYHIPNTAIAVAGLNPHSGEGGAFGGEEIQHIIPAIEEAKGKGINVVGPLPPDSIFVRALKGQFQVMVVMYHDQGHIPAKIINFEEGVNITLGLPIIRTSVDHGTAFGKAGKGTASPASMEAALNKAATMALQRYYGK